MPLNARPILSSLRLQQVLYFNSLFSVVAFAGYITCLVYKLTQFENVSLITRIVWPIFVGLWSLLEPFRLNLGISGNLKEKVPDISAFLLVTGFPNLPIVIGLTIAPAQSLPLERLLGVPLLLFTIVEIVLAYSAVTSFVRSQTAQFYRLVLEDSITGQGGVTGAQVGGYSGVPSHQIRSGLKLPSGTATSDGNSPPASPHSDLSGDEEDEQGGRRGGAGSVPAAQLHRRRSGGRQGTVPRADSSADRGGRAIRSPEGGVQGGAPTVTMSDIVSHGTRGLAARLGGRRGGGDAPPSESGGEGGRSASGRRQRLQPTNRRAAVDDDDGY